MTWADHPKGIPTIVLSWKERQRMRRPLRFRFFLLSTFLAASDLCDSVEAATRTIQFRTDGKSQEQKYLWKHSSRTFVLEGWGKPVRNLDGVDQFVVWRFDVSDVTAARFRVHLLNSYALSISSNGRDFRQVSKQTASGGSNQGWKTADLTPLLPVRYVYVKVEHGAEKQGGYGACIFGVHVELEGQPLVAMARAARLREAPVIDGELSEPGWQHAQPLSTLAERFMKHIPQRQTTFRLAWDHEHWYFAAQCEQPAADKALAGAKEQDSAVYTDDCVECFLSPPGREDYYHFAANLIGTVFDEHNEAGADSWTSKARVATRRTPGGWTLEAAIPVSSMQATMEEGRLWRIGLYRVNLESVQYTAWSSIEGGGFHSPHRFGRVKLIEAAKKVLRAVNISLTQPVALGKHPTTLLCTASVDPKQHELTLDVMPIKSSAIPPAQQDLTQMNPIFKKITWSEIDTGSTPRQESTHNRNPSPTDRHAVKTTITLDRFGAAHIVATLREQESGDIISRSIQSVTLTREQVEPIILTLQQPFVSTEATLPVEVRLNIQEKRRKGANVVATLTNQAGHLLYSSKTKAAKATNQLAFPIADLSPGNIGF